MSIPLEKNTESTDNLKVPTMLTIKETSKRTGLAEHYIRRLVWENKVVFVKAGQKYLINLEKLIERLNEGETAQPERPKGYGTIRPIKA